MHFKFGLFSINCITKVLYHEDVRLLVSPTLANIVYYHILSLYQSDKA